MKIIPKYRTETCLHLARNLASLGKWRATGDDIGTQSDETIWIRERCEEVRSENNETERNLLIPNLASHSMGKRLALRQDSHVR